MNGPAVLRRSKLPEIGIGLLAAVSGAFLAVEPNIGLVLAVAAIGIVLLAAPTWAWVAATLISALLLPGIANLGLLPPISKFLDIPLAWTAFGIALIDKVVSRRASHEGEGALGPAGSLLPHRILILSTTVILSAVLHPEEPMRPLAYLLLIAQPFAVVGALLLDPPDVRGRKVLSALVIGLAVLQVPFAAFQATTQGLSDPVQGTLYGKGAGAHLVGGIAILGAGWVLARRWGSTVLRSLVVVSLLVLPFLADAKAVLIASVPMWLLLAPSTRMRLSSRGLIVVGLLVAFIAYPASQATIGFLEQAGQGRWGKLVATELVWDEINRSPANLLLGLGPASTVSRASFMTTDLLLSADSPLTMLELRPSTFAVRVQMMASVGSGESSSFTSPLSSALGVLGDLGLVGLAAYVRIPWLLIRRAIGSGGLLGRTVVGMWLMFAVLGLVFDWWEEPPFTVPLAIITGLALLDRFVQPRQRAVAPRIGSSPP